MAQIRGKRYKPRLLPMCLGRSTPTAHPRVQGKVPSLIPSSIPLNGLLLAQLYTYVLPKILQNGAKLEKTDSWFQKSHEEFGKH